MNCAWDVSRLVTACATCLAIAFVFDARADDKAAAKAAFAEGRSFFERGEYERAAEAFREAHELSPNWKLLYNIGQCEALAKRPGLALQALEAYLVHGGDDVPAARREDVLAEVERLRKMVGAVEISAPDGARILLDGTERERAPLPGPMMIAAGVKHDLVIRLGERVLLSRPVRVSGGQTVSVVTKADQEATRAPAADVRAESGGGGEPPPMVEPADEGGASLSTWGWTSAGVGGALLIGGGITGGMALSINGELESRCVDGVCIEPADQNENDKMQSLATATNVLIGVGVAAVATGVILLVVDGDEDEEEAPVAVGPTVGRAFSGVQISGRF